MDLALAFGESDEGVSVSLASSARRWRTRAIDHALDEIERALTALDRALAPFEPMGSVARASARTR
jgi:hypothetical protein